MPHSPKPWWHKRRRRWMLEVDGRPVTLGPHPDGAPPPKKGKTGWNVPRAVQEEADRVLLEQRAPHTPASGQSELWAVLDAFLASYENHRKRSTFESYRDRIASFQTYLQGIGLSATLAVEDLRPFHLRDWVESHKNWSPGMQRGCIMAVQTALNWAVEEGRIDRSPVAKMKKPPQGKRDVIISAEEYRRILGHVPRQPLRDLLTCAWETGARPQELFIVEARHLQDGAWTFAPVEAKGGKWRAVYLNDAALEVARRLNAAHPDGPIFRNTEGEPWNAFSVNCAFLRLKAKLGKKYCLYNFRHSWATEALKVLDPVTVAVLMGHADPSMLAKVYQHLGQDRDYLRNEAGKIRRGNT